MVTSSSERNINPSRYTGVVDLLRRIDDVIEIIANNLMYSSISYM